MLVNLICMVLLIDLGETGHVVELEIVQLGHFAEPWPSRLGNLAHVHRLHASFQM